MPLANLAQRRSLKYLYCAFSSIPPLEFGTLTLTKCSHKGVVTLAFLFFLVEEPEPAGPSSPVGSGSWGL